MKDAEGVGNAAFMTNTDSRKGLIATIECPKNLSRLTGVAMNIEHINTDIIC